MSESFEPDRTTGARTFALIDDVVGIAGGIERCGGDVESGGAGDCRCCAALGRGLGDGDGRGRAAEYCDWI